MKPLGIMAVVIVVLGFGLSATGQQVDEDGMPIVQAGVVFVQPGTWWNLYFTKGNNPLQRGPTSVHAVKILEVDASRPSWIKICFPKDKTEHLSLLKAIAKVRRNDDTPIELTLAAWERTVSEWRIIWVNLEYVVSATKVEPGEPPEEE